jgi:EAL domain-containing protein (putative c-di-GMP-specific phosphodiesterase class I)
MVESILALARTLQTGVVAEGVEDERQARELERFGCLYAQGFLFSPALPAPVAEQLIAARQPLGTRPWRPGTSIPVQWPEPAAAAGALR